MYLSIYVLLDLHLDKYTLNALYYILDRYGTSQITVTESKGGWAQIWLDGTEDVYINHPIFFI